MYETLLHEALASLGCSQNFIESLLLRPWQANSADIVPIPPAEVGRRPRVDVAPRISGASLADICGYMPEVTATSDSGHHVDHGGRNPADIGGDIRRIL